MDQSWWAANNTVGERHFIFLQEGLLVDNNRAPVDQYKAVSLAGFISGFSCFFLALKLSCLFSNNYVY